MSKPKQVVIIDNWKLVKYPVNGYSAPETLSTVLVGDIKDHPIKGAGTIRTSRVIWFSSILNIAETNNTIYNLGEPDKDWLTWLSINDIKLDQYDTTK